MTGEHSFVGSSVALMRYLLFCGPNKDKKTMEEQNTVSVWLGSANSESDWAHATETQVTEDGDFLGAEFCRAFEIAWYDEDFQEAEFYQRAPPTLGLLLRGVSYDLQVIGRLEPFDHRFTPADNCFVLLYNFRYTGSKTTWSQDGVELRFVGAVSYDQ